MKYFLDTEFIEDGVAIDLISIGIVSDDQRTLYLQNEDCDFSKANDFVGRNVCPQLAEFDMGKRERTCSSLNKASKPTLDGACSAICYWRSRQAIRDSIKEFIAGDKPEFWAYFASYDWVAFCQLFGIMMDLPADYPHYCNDIVQWARTLGYPKLPPKPINSHNALADAMWNMEAWNFLFKYKP